RGEHAYNLSRRSYRAADHRAGRQGGTGGGRGARSHRARRRGVRPHRMKREIASTPASGVPRRSVSGTTSFPSLGAGPPGPAAPDYAAGNLVVGRYLIRECVGAGPLGIVYRAEDLLVHDDVAVRIVWPDLVPDDRARLTLLRGATAARALQNPF